MGQRPSPGLPRRHGPSGFTLVELLVAMAAMAAISAMTWKSVDAMSGAVEASRAKSEALLSLSRAAQSLRADLSAARCPWAPAPPRGLPPVANGATPAAPAAPVQFAEPATLASWDHASLVLTRDAGRLGAQVVAWSPRPGGLTRLAMAPSSDMASWRQAWMQASSWAGDPGASAPELAEAEPHAGAAAFAGAEFRFDDAWSAGPPERSCPSPAEPSASIPELTGARIALAPAADAGLSGPISISWASPLLTGAAP